MLAIKVLTRCSKFFTVWYVYDISTRANTRQSVLHEGFTVGIASRGGNGSLHQTTILVQAAINGREVLSFRTTLHHVKQKIPG